MKKVLFGILCIGAAIGCAREEVKTSNEIAIAFTDTFINPQMTRSNIADPTITTGTIDAFKVWGFMDSVGGLMFDGELVTKENGEWTYEHTQFWAPNHTYYFGALAPVENCNWTLDKTNANEYGLGVVSFTNLEGTEDLLYTATSVKTPDINTLLSAGMDPVSILFNHLLSKIKFTFINGFTTPNITMKVSDIQMTVPKAASIDLAVENWWDNDDWKLTGTETTTLDFADVPVLEITKSAPSANERLTIPADKTASYDISFKVTLYVGDQIAMEVDKTATLTNVAFNMGKSYNIKTEINPENLGLHPIEFDVIEVKDWVPADDSDATVNK